MTALAGVVLALVATSTSVADVCGPPERDLAPCEAALYQAGARCVARLDGCQAKLAAFGRAPDPTPPVSPLPVLTPDACPPPAPLPVLELVLGAGGVFAVGVLVGLLAGR